jgi:SAM-dependent methyltransferase
VIDLRRDTHNSSQTGRPEAEQHGALAIDASWPALLRPFPLRVPDLSRRVRVPEAMDHPALPRTLHDQALRGLARVNRISRVGENYWQELRPICRNLNRPPAVLDVACGAADVLLDLASRARRNGCMLEPHGCDVSPTAVGHARAQAQKRGLPARFTLCDALQGPLPSCDVAICSLFLHHLADGQVVALLQRMKAAARLGLVISDLERTTFGYLLARLTPPLLSRSPVVAVDSERSVRAALRRREAATLARQAGLHGAQVGRRWPWRFALVWWRRPPPVP